METLDLTGGVDDALLTGEEGVAGRAQLYADFRPVEPVVHVLPQEQMTFASS